MRAENTLRIRLITAFVLLGIVVGGVFGAASYVIIEAAEYELIDVRLTRAAPGLVESHRSSNLRPAASDLRLAVGVEIPDAIQRLGPGLHDVELDGRAFHVLLLEDHGERYAVIDDISDFARLEAMAFAGLLLGFFAGVVLALGIARTSVSRIFAPLTALATAVKHDDLAAHPALLAASDEIGVLARAFDVRTSQLQHALTRERLFTADVSHELRTPLTVILGAAELLGGGISDASELRAVAERIRRTSAEAAMRVSALLQLARSPEKIERVPVELRALLEQEVERCRPLLEDKPVEVVLDAPGEVWVKASPELAAIAIGNLLRNAFRFTQSGSVRMSLAAGRLVIEDTGPGVPAGVRSRLFEPFVKGQEGAPTGDGLGLSIVKRVAEHLGWAIRLDDGAAGGSRFTISVRAADAI